MSAPGPWRDAAPAPRGPYQSFPQAPPPPMPEHPFAGAHRASFYAAPIPGFYSPSLAQPAPGLPLGRGGAPPFPRPELPPSLVPGRKPTYSFTRSNSDDYFFQADSPILRSRQPQSPPAPPPPIPRKPDLSHPLLPPKPSFESSSASTSPSSPPLSYPRHYRALSFPRADAGPSAPPLPPPIPPPPPAAHHADDEVFNHVLDISAQEVERTKELERRRQEQARMTEEAHLAMALEASLKIGSPPTMSGRDGGSSFITSSPEQGPSTAPLHSPIADISLNPTSEAGTRRARANSHVAQQIIDDEALALQLAQEEERLAEQERVRGSNARARSSSQLAAAGGPPQYHEAVSSPPVASPGSLGPPVPAQSLLNAASPSRSSSPHMPSLGRSVSDKPCPPKTVTPDQKRVSRSQSLGEGIPSATTTILAPKPQNSRSISITSSSWEPTDDEDGHSPQSAPSHTAELPSNTQYLDSELLLGLSMGFGVPTITPNPKPFPGVIPNVIALPYGKCPPFHIMAPSWRTLLKLMARLSGTRLEPTVEAMAVVKTEMRLRIVVSFVKVHHASSEWYTVLYMTIDHPIPPSAPAGWRYRNGDTSTLPWSYTLAQQPPFLRDGADAPLSKFYTIPVNQDTPFPTLPISFPNLATYLASALENSRDAMHDSSSGLRRLAKYIDQFYPSDRAGLDDAPERSGMRQRLKNLVGIGHKPQRDRNAEMYELVTPFVPDDFGR